MNQASRQRHRIFHGRLSLASLSARGLLVAALAFPTSVFAVTRQKLDFVVGVNGDFKAAMTAAAKAGGKRFVIFFPDGEYNIGSLTGDSNQKTTFTTSNVSFVGQSMDKTVVYNKSVNEGIGITATLYFNNADNLYLQDLTLFNKAVYGNTSLYNTTGRHVVVQEQGDKIIYKNVRLKSTQDTYYSKGTKTYWEGGEIHGTTDFICGAGDVYFSKVLIYALKKSALTAPSSTSNTYGYVFQDCIIDGDASDFTLGRSWNDGRAVFLNTTMKKLPVSTGWGDPMNSVPKMFAEYKSVNSSGTAIDLSKRRKSYTLDGTTVTLNPVLTDAEAAKYTIGNVLGGWSAQNATKQVTAPVVAQSGSTLKWDDNADALCWVLFKGGKYLASVTTNSYDASSLAKGDVITVRAANEMGGLGTSSAALTVGNTTSIGNADAIAAGLGHRYDRSAKAIRITSDHAGVLRASLHTLDGTTVAYRSAANATSLDLPLIALKPGVYVLQYGDGRAEWAGSIDLW